MDRILLMGKEVVDFIDGPWSNDKDEGRAARLRADLESFVTGNTITVSLSPYKKEKACYMAILAPPTDGIWCIRSRDPKPGLRVFGAFAAKNTFIALTCTRRSLLDGPGGPIWKNEIRRAKAEWRKLFPSYDTMRGNDLDEYLEKYLDVGGI